MGGSLLWRSNYKKTASGLAAATIASMVSVAFAEGPSLCTHAEADAPGNNVASAPGELLSWSTVDDVAIVLEYDSVYDVHTPLNPDQPIRSQPGSFFSGEILQDLECFVDPSSYDFVLLYSLQEVPGWIHSGPRNSCPRKKHWTAQLAVWSARRLSGMAEAFAGSAHERHRVGRSKPPCEFWHFDRDARDGSYVECFLGESIAGPQRLGAG